MPLCLQIPGASLSVCISSVHLCLVVPSTCSHIETNQTHCHQNPLCEHPSRPSHQACISLYRLLLVTEAYTEGSQSEYTADEEGTEEEAEISPPGCLTTPLKKAFNRYPHPLSHPCWHCLTTVLHARSRRPMRPMCKNIAQYAQDAWEGSQKLVALPHMMIKHASLVPPPLCCQTPEVGKRDWMQGGEPLQELQRRHHPLQAPQRGVLVP